MRSGAERRNRNWAAALQRFDASTGIKTRGQAEAIIAFFRARGSRAQGFRFKDWSDYRAVAQVLGTGDGASGVTVAADSNLRRRSEELGVESGRHLRTGHS